MRLLLWLALVLPSVLNASPAWWRERVFYEIFPRSFQDTNGDGIGDINGITRRLDYLKSLGIGGIWLTPVFASPSYHGYDTTDYESVQPEYGTNADLQKLIDQAHARDIRVILDLAINHTSHQHPWFRSSSLPDWYVRRDSPANWGMWFPDGKNFYFSVFSSHMPQLNWRNTEVRTAVRKTAEYWLGRGLDGYRLDAARYYAIGEHGEADTVETHRALAEFSTNLRSSYPDRLIVGEIWADSKTIASYGGGDELDLAFAFPIAGGLVESVRQNRASDFVNALRENVRDIVDSGYNAPFLTNHDQIRVATTLQKDPARLALAAEVLLLLPGTPFLYYGEEIGMANGPAADDRDKRTPMLWAEGSGHGFTSGTPWYPFPAERAARSSVATQESDPSSLLNRYKAAIALRRGNPVLSRGTMLRAETRDNDRLALWQRQYQGEKALVVVNFSDKTSAAQTVDIDGNSLPCRVPSLAPRSVAIYSPISSCQSNRFEP